jgi:uncharacterized protein
MILTDAGPLIAILDRGERDHEACVACLAELTPPMLTTWPAFSEAMYLLEQGSGWRAQDALWGLIQSGDLEIAAQAPELYERMRSLMAKYYDLPMDLADASLVALAEVRGLHDIFTLDQADFRVYRPKRRHFFRLWPRNL